MNQGVNLVIYRYPASGNIGETEDNMLFVYIDAFSMYYKSTLPTIEEETWQLGGITVIDCIIQNYSDPFRIITEILKGRPDLVLAKNALFTVSCPPIL